MPASFLDRYRSGEYAQVWADLLALGEEVRQEPVLPDALAVARETMARAKANLDALIPRLDALGYRFQMPRHPAAPLDLAVRNLPPPDATAKADEIERLIGPLPLSLRAWYEVVGGVCLVGQRAGWPGIVTADPLEAGAVEHAVTEAHAWVDMRQKYGETRPPYIVIASDRYQKADISGDTYFINLPNAAADAPLEQEPHQTTFVDYLRISFAWGGFPGFSLAQSYPRGAIAALTTDLLPL